MAIRWVDAVFETGVPEIDEQHKELLRRVDQLLEASSKGGDPAEVEKMIRFLGD